MAERASKVEMEKRILLARLLRARGTTWPEIARKMSLSRYQIDTLRENVNIERKQTIDEIEIEMAYSEYKDSAFTAISEIQEIIDSNDDPSLLLEAIIKKVGISKEVLQIGIESGIWRDSNEELTLEATKRITATGKVTTESIMQRLKSSSVPTRVIDAEFEEQVDD